MHGSRCFSLHKATLEWFENGVHISLAVHLSGVENILHISLDVENVVHISLAVHSSDVNVVHISVAVHFVFRSAWLRGCSNVEKTKSGWIPTKPVRSQMQIPVCLFPLYTYTVDCLVTF